MVQKLLQHFKGPTSTAKDESNTGLSICRERTPRDPWRVVANGQWVNLRKLLLLRVSAGY